MRCRRSWKRGSERRVSKVGSRLRLRYVRRQKRQSPADSLDDAQRALGRHDSCQLQSRFPENLRELLFGALAPSDDKHLYIKELAPVGIVTRRDDAFDDKYPAFLTHGGATFC